MASCLPAKTVSSTHLDDEWNGPRADDRRDSDRGDEAADDDDDRDDAERSMVSSSPASSSSSARDSGFREVLDDVGGTLAVHDVVASEPSSPGTDVRPDGRSRRVEGRTSDSVAQGSAGSCHTSDDSRRLYCRKGWSDGTAVSTEHMFVVVVTAREKDPGRARQIMRESEGKEVQG